MQQATQQAMKPARNQQQQPAARQQAWPWRALVALATQKKSQRIATRPTRDAPHAQPHVHSPCAQPLDDGWLPHVKMLQLLARCAERKKAQGRAPCASWRLASCSLASSCGSASAWRASRACCEAFSLAGLCSEVAAASERWLRISLSREACIPPAHCTFYRSEPS